MRAWIALCDEELEGRAVGVERVDEFGVFFHFGADFGDIGWLPSKQTISNYSFHFEVHGSLF